MKRVLFITNIASPYRVCFFDELGKNLDVTVLFHDSLDEHRNRAKEWFEPGTGGYHSVQLCNCIAKFGGERLCVDVINWLKKPFDAIVVCGYSSPTVMLAMAWMRLHRIPFFMEIDGGLIREDSKLKYGIKKRLVSLANAWLSSGEYPTEYLVHYGAKRERVFAYPFSSLWEADLRETVVPEDEKRALRRELGIEEEKMVLTVGQFIPRKGFDVLLRAAASLDPQTGIYFVGGEPTEEYLQLREKLGLSHVHFLGFRKKEELARYYQAADLFVLPTREDIWGLVVNEAMAYGLPVVTTDKCVAGRELVEDGVNGYLVPAENASVLAEKIAAVLAGDPAAMGAASLEKIRPYTIENMVRAHVEILNQTNRKGE